MKKEKETFINLILTQVKRNKTLKELKNYTQGVIDALYPNADEVFRNEANTFAGSLQTYSILSKEMEKILKKYKQANKEQLWKIAFVGTAKNV